MENKQRRRAKKAPEPQQKVPLEQLCMDAMRLVWKETDGNATTMESYPIKMVMKGTRSTALLVALSPDGQKGFGMRDDGAGNAGVEVFDLSDLGHRSDLVVGAYDGKDTVFEALWKAREGVAYL